MDGACCQLGAKDLLLDVSGEVLQSVSSREHEKYFPPHGVRRLHHIYLSASALKNPPPDIQDKVMHHHDN